ncbi:MAG: hypothetical protein MnENMB40S_21140 [Rhizobiaceae bacterium MnEN-MB40S]|nr:MAG: hypothetical protein MnENMB40S_21140 [Rhizobiaceae bacterium MnEN-MB40S]
MESPLRRARDSCFRNRPGRRLLATIRDKPASQCRRLVEPRFKREHIGLCQEETGSVYIALFFLDGGGRFVEPGKRWPVAAFMRGEQVRIDPLDGVRAHSARLNWDATQW